MAISIILAHPNPASFNHAIAQSAAKALGAAGHTVNLHDLHAEKFDPILPTSELGKIPTEDPLVHEHCREIAEADGIVIVHPNWWAQPPAILKGWIDRVFRQGVTYEFRVNEKGQFGPAGLLKAKAAVVFNTSNTPLEQELALYGDPLDNLWKTCIFQFCGLKNVTRRLYTSVVLSTPDQRAAWLKDAEETVRQCFPAR